MSIISKLYKRPLQLSKEGTSNSCNTVDFQWELDVVQFDTHSTKFHIVKGREQS